MEEEYYTPLHRLMRYFEMIIIIDSTGNEYEQLTCLLLVVVVGLLLEVMLELASLLFSPLVEPDAVLDVNDTDAAGVDPVVKVVVKQEDAFEFVEAAMTPLVVAAVECTTDELAIRSESLSDISELLEELSLMSQ